MKKMECWLSLKISKEMKDAIDAAVLKNDCTITSWIRAAIRAAIDADAPRPVGRPSQMTERQKDIAAKQAIADRLYPEEAAERKRRESALLNDEDIMEEAARLAVPTMKFNAAGDPIDENGNEIPYDPDAVA